MRGGGRLFLLLGVVVAAAAALLLFFFIQPQGQGPQQVVPTTPTVVPKVQVVVARVDLPVNTILTDTETFLTTDSIPEPEFNSQPGTYFTNPADVLNKLTTRPVQANAPIRKADVIDGGLSLLLPTALPDQPRPKAIPFQVSTLTGVADLVTPGDFVDLVVTFKIERSYLRPTLQQDPQTKQYTVAFVEDKFTDSSTKTLIQKIQVLKILKPRTDESTTPTPAAAGGAPATNPDGTAAGAAPAAGPAPGDTFVPGNWIVILAVTDQQAEIIRYSLAQSTGMAMVLRGRGDDANETTVGATLAVLVNQFGLPAPDPLMVPPVDVNELTPTPGR